MKKIKVVLLCHYSSPELRSHLALSDLKIENLFNRVFRRPKYSFGDFASWVTLIISELCCKEEMEIHIIAPHYGLKKKVVEFMDNMVYYHIFRSELPFPFNIFEHKINPEQGRSFKRNRKIVKQIIDKIKPDLVNLIGSENPYYSICSLDINDIPILLSCQTVYSNPDRIHKDLDFSQFRWDVEQKIFKHVQYYACGGELHRGLVKKYIPDAMVLKLIWPRASFPVLKEVPKIYDFVYFAQMISAKKGADNAVEALAKVKIKCPNVSLLMIGHNIEPFKSEIEKRILELGLNHNITFHDFFEKQEDMFQYAKQARFALLPIKLDIVSGTIIQAMRMGLPVVSHITSGTPQINETRTCMLLSPINNNNELAENMLRLLDSPELAEKLKNNAFEYIRELDSKEINAGEFMVGQYKAVIDNYYSGIPIPVQYMFDENGINN